jgi:hypothetical protein
MLRDEPERKHIVLMPSLKMAFGLAVMAAMVIVGVKVVPVYFNNYEFEDAVKNEALQATYSSRTEDDIRDTVIKRAKDYDIALTPKQVKVSRTGQNGNGNLSIDVVYTMDINLPGYSTTVEFHPSSSNKGVF